MADAILRVSGIYAIQNTINKKMYVGSAVNIKRRWDRHRAELRCGIHHSVKLQRAWNKYGKDAFAWMILEEVVKDRLIEREQHWMDRHHAAVAGYNHAARAGSCFGVRHTDETKKKVSEANKLKWSDPVYRENQRLKRVGVKRSEQTKAKISASNMGIGAGVKQSAETIARRKATITRRLASGEITMATPMTAERLLKLQEAQRTPDVKERMRLAKVGRKQSPESIAKRVAAIAATRAANPPKPISEETRMKMSLAQKGKKKRPEDVARRVATLIAKNIAKRELEAVKEEGPALGVMGDA